MFLGYSGRFTNSALGRVLLTKLGQASWVQLKRRRAPHQPRNTQARLSLRRGDESEKAKQNWLPACADTRCGNGNLTKPTFVKRSILVTHEMFAVWQFQPRKLLLRRQECIIILRARRRPRNGFRVSLGWGAPVVECPVSHLSSPTLGLNDTP